MLEAEKLIRRIVYSLPEKSYCTILGRRVPCGVNWVDRTLGIYAGFDYPSVTPKKQAVICESASLAAVAAATSLAGVVKACQDGVGLDAIAASLPAANSILRETFFKCIESSGLPDEVKKRVDIGIYLRDE